MKEWEHIWYSTLILLKTQFHCFPNVIENGISLLLNKFSLTCLLPLPTTTFLRHKMSFWDVLSMKKKWALYLGQHCGQGKTVLRLLFFHNCLLLGCFWTAFLPAPSYSGCLRWKKVPSILSMACTPRHLILSSVNSWSVRRDSSQLPCTALHPLSLLAGVFGVRGAAGGWAVPAACRGAPGS